MNELNNNKRRVYIRPVDALEFIYDLIPEWEKKPEPFKIMKNDIKLMISYFKEEKFEELQEKFRIPTLYQ